jgi:hypothetical protein
MTDSQRKYTVGEVGGEHLRIALASGAPGDVIAKFQAANSLSPASCSPALPLLDLLQLPRSYVYKHVLTNLCSLLLSRIPAMTQEQLASLRTQCLPYVHVPELREVVLTVLKHTEIIPTEALRLLTTDELYSHCPIEVRIFTCPRMLLPPVSVSCDACHSLNQKKMNNHHFMLVV